MSEALSEDELSGLREKLESHSFPDNIIMATGYVLKKCVSEIDRLRAENKELREEDLSGTKAKIKAIEQITYYRSEVNRLNNVLAERDTRIDMLREIVRECREWIDDVSGGGGWHDTEYDEDEEKSCISGCKGCGATALLARIDKALEEK